MSAFNGAEDQIPPRLLRNTQISLSTLLNTFNATDRVKLQTWLASMNSKQKQQITAHMETFEYQKQRQFLAEMCSCLSACQTPTMGAGVTTPEQTQAMATLVDNLGSAQQQYMLKNLSAAARSHISPVMAKNPGAILPVSKGRIADSTSQNHLSVGDELPALQPSNLAISNGDESTHAQQISTATNGHQRRSSSSVLPPPSPTTRVNCSAPLDDQQNLNPGLGGDILMQASMPNGKLGNDYQNHHRRTSSSTISLPSPSAMPSGNVTPTSLNRWPINGLGSSPPRHPSMFNREVLGSNSQQGRLSNGAMLPPSPTRMVYGNATLFGQEDRLMNSPGSSPMMPPSMSNGPTMARKNTQRRVLNTTLPPTYPLIMVNGNRTQNAQRGRAMSDSGSSPPRSSSIPSGLQMPTQRRLISSQNKQPMTMIDGSDSLPKVSAANSFNQRRLSNSGNNLFAPQSPVNKQSAHVITLARSGGIIEPTTISKSINASNNSNGQRQMGSVIDLSGSSSMRNTTLGQKSTSAIPLPSGDIAPNPANAALHGFGSSSNQQFTGGTIAYLPSPSFAPVLANGGHNLSPRPNERRLSSPSESFPGMSPPATMPNTLTQNLGSSPFVPPPSTLHSYFTSPTPATGSSPRAVSTISNANSSPIMPDSQSHSHPPPPMLHRAHTSPLPNSRSMGPPPRPAIQKSVSQSDGRATIQFQPLLFCRGCPWRQIDIKKARICEGCKAEKLEIIKHRHTKFSSLNEDSRMDLGRGKGIGHGQLANTHKRTCMICPGLVAAKCQDCPLRVCTDCEVLLMMMCK
jgi:hypothetical protein